MLINILASFQVTLTSSHSTLYWCKILKGPTLKKKHHITMVSQGSLRIASGWYECINHLQRLFFLQIKPLITPGHEAYVHHVLVYECVGGDPSEFEPHVELEGHQCDHPNVYSFYARCDGVIAAWGVGGEVSGNTYYSLSSMGIVLYTEYTEMLSPVYGKHIDYMGSLFWGPYGSKVTQMGSARIDAGIAYLVKQFFFFFFFGGGAYGDVTLLGVNAHCSNPICARMSVLLGFNQKFCNFLDFYWSDGFNSLVTSWRDPALPGY